MEMVTSCRGLGDSTNRRPSQVVMLSATRYADPGSPQVCVSRIFRIMHAQMHWCVIVPLPLSNMHSALMYTAARTTSTPVPIHAFPLHASCFIARIVAVLQAANALGYSRPLSGGPQDGPLKPTLSSGAARPPSPLGPLASALEPRNSSGAAATAAAAPLPPCLPSASVSIEPSGAWGGTNTYTAPNADGPSASVAYTTTTLTQSTAMPLGVEDSMGQLAPVPAHGTSPAASMGTGSMPPYREEDAEYLR